MDAARGLRFSANPLAYRRILLHFFVLIGALLLVIGIIFGAITLLFLWQAQSTEGQVVGFEKVEDAAPFLAASPEDSTLFYPIIEYRDLNNRRHQFVASFGGYRRRLQEGDLLAVRFHPRGIGAPRIDHWWYIWGRSLILVGLGALFGLIGLLMPHAFQLSRESSPNSRSSNT